MSRIDLPCVSPDTSRYVCDYCEQVRMVRYSNRIVDVTHPLRAMLTVCPPCYQDIASINRQWWEERVLMRDRLASPVYA